MVKPVSTARVVVTGGDAGYFPLIEELAASIRAHRTAEQLGLAVIDAGLEPGHREHLVRRYGVRLLDVGWELEVPASRVRGRDHLKVQVARAFLDRYLPETELISWIDADAWVQDPSALDLLFRGAELSRLAIVSQTSRYSEVAMTLRWGPFGWAQVRSILYKNARRAGVPEAQARRIGDRPTLNSGVFALHREAPQWALWRARQAEVIRRGRIFTSDQLSLALAVYVDGAPVELMPETCNYMGALWTCSADEGTLVERYLPNAPVGVVHMAGYDAMRRDLEVTAPVRTLDGRVVQRSLRRPAWVSAP
ncbi:MAG: glycosyl transferase [Proteobacteria bacterium]|nr:glycosyl transferase [Pseudomonadota bacterium]